MDFRKNWRGKRIFGDNKRWRGLLVGIILATITGSILYNLPDVSVSHGVFVLGSAAMGFGALAGDAIESLFKRQANIAPGNSWFPFDQIDYIAGGLLFSYPLLHPSATTIVCVFVVYFGLHLVFSYIGFLLGLKNKPI